MKKKLPTPNYYYIIRQTLVKETHLLHTGWLCLRCQTENQPTKKMLNKKPTKQKRINKNPLA